MRTDKSYKLQCKLQRKYFRTFSTLEVQAPLSFCMLAISFPCLPLLLHVDACFPS